MSSRLAVDLFQECQKLRGAMTGQTFADDHVARHVEACKRPRRPVTLVIMGHGAGSALLHRQARLCAVKGLDLALLVDGKHQRLGRRIAIKTHDIRDFRGKFGIFGDFETAHEMGFEAILVPDSLYAGVADAHLPGHPTDAPMRGVDGALPNRLIDDLALDPAGDRLLAGRLGTALKQAPRHRPW